MPKYFGSSACFTKAPGPGKASIALCKNILKQEVNERRSERFDKGGGFIGIMSLKALSHNTLACGDEAGGDERG
jgi:hypothetical protein